MAMALQQKPLLAIASTFTADPIEETLAFWLRNFNLPFDIRFAAYNQVFQELIDDRSLLAGNQDGVNVLLVRLEDWQGTGPLASQVEQSSREFMEALRAAADRSTVPYLVCLCAASPAAAADPLRSAALARAEETLVAEFKDAPTVHVLTAADVAQVFPVKEYYSPHTDQMGHVPYTGDYFTALGTTLSRRIWALRSPPYKVIVLDCDGTLWKGTCGEDGPDGVAFGRPWHWLQEFMVQQYEAGMLLCICSKNSEDDVFAVFDQRRQEMPLRREHIVSWRVNWRAKSENLRSLAAELALGLDGFIMLDDNPIECAEIEANCPEVLTLQLPAEEDKMPSFLRRVWAFDHLKVTGEDRNRTEYYRAQARRETARTVSPTLEDFLRGLQLQIEIAPAQAHHLERVAQLTQRTNQFNVSGIRRTLSEVQRLYDEADAGCCVVHLRDRFGDYGLVGVIMHRKLPHALMVDSFMLSCRALGRKVEHRMFSELGRIARSLRATQVEIPFKASPKNEPARHFLESFGKQFRSIGESGALFRFPSEFAAGVGQVAIQKRFTVELTERA
jgi:FkbH-like protein